MKINNNEKKILKKRLNQLKEFMIFSLKNNRVDDYLNTVNSRELKMLETLIIKDDLKQMISISL